MAAGAAHEAAHSAFQEWLLMGLSVGIAASGVYAAYYFVIKRREAADRLVQATGGVHRMLQNKYYVDEVFNAVFVDGLSKGSGTALWKFDASVVDGGVNGAAWLTRFTSTLSIWWDTWVVDGAVRLSAFIVKVMSYPVRLLQTGLVQAYALFIVLGVLIFFSYYLLR